MELQKLDYCNETTKLKQTIETSFLTLGERLKRIRDERLYEGQWGTFEMYLMDAKISPATASKLINIYQKFFIEWQIKADKLVEAGGWSVVATLLPFCRTKEQAEEWMDKAFVLSRPDLEKEITEFRTGKDMSKCEHEDSYVIRVCRSCHFRERVYEADATTQGQ